MFTLCADGHNLDGAAIGFGATNVRHRPPNGHLFTAREKGVFVAGSGGRAGECVLYHLMALFILLARPSARRERIFRSI